MSPEGGGKKRFYLVGTDYVYPRTTNKILRIYLTKAKGVQESGIMEYTPSTTRTIRPSWGRSRASALGAMGPSSIPSTVIATCHSSKSWPIRASRPTCPVISFSFAEVELQTLDVKPLAGHLASWNYYMSLKTPRTSSGSRTTKTGAKNAVSPRSSA